MIFPIIYSQMIENYERFQLRSQIFCREATIWIAERHVFATRLRVFVCLSVCLSVRLSVCLSAQMKIKGFSLKKKKT